MFSRYPPHLISLPGSGGGWLRLLIEYATGIYSGSMDMFDSEYLKDGNFPGEIACGIRTSIIRSHPHFFYYHMNKMHFRYVAQSYKCKRGLIREIKKMVMLIRNPYDALWSYYQLLNSLKHSGFLTKHNFRAEAWHKVCPNIAAFWSSDWHRFMQPVLNKYTNDTMFTVRYEDLLDDNKKVTILSKLMSFMDFKASTEKLECAFLLADKGFIHKPKNPERVGSYEAYYQSGKENLICDLAPMFISYAQYFGYNMHPTTEKPPPVSCD